MVWTGFVYNIQSGIKEDKLILKKNNSSNLVPIILNKKFILVEVSIMEIAYCIINKLEVEVSWNGYDGAVVSNQKEIIKISSSNETLKQEKYNKISVEEFFILVSALMVLGRGKEVSNLLFKKEMLN